MNTHSQNRSAWMSAAGWGLMFHYIDKPASSNEPSTTTAADWNRRIDGFDVANFSRRVRESGAAYVIFTLGQNTGHFCSPNSVYDDIVGVRPSLLSRRDLVAEIATALAPDVRLIAYLPSHAPANHAEAIRAFKLMPSWDAGAWGLKRDWTEADCADERLTFFQRRWESVVAHWGERWGSLVSGWWIDGCYFAKHMYDATEGPNFASFAQALRAGNADRILAFNSGTVRPFERLSLEQDYTAGEFSDRLPVPNKWAGLESKTDGMQTHLLGYLGSWWGEGSPRLSDALAAGYTREVVSRGAAITWDVPLAADGSIAEPFLRQFEHLQSHVATG
jgi:hypothetical protein